MHQTQTQSLETLLEKYFGYTSFRPFQKEIIENVLDHKDCFVLMPTGGGKSLCYQLPALCFDGITLVISPLIALMKDQVDSLKANGIEAEFINSTLSESDIQDIQNRVRQAEIKILYIAPERLASLEFQDFLGSVQVSFIAIDEAHCISEWGHDFRPDYRNLVQLRSMYPGVPVMALTATATQKVREDIVKQLELDAAKSFVASFDRHNLTYTVYPKKDAFDTMLGLLKKHPNQSAIIYCFSRKNTENIALNLQQEGIKALPYHAGLSAEKRRLTQEQFVRDEVSVITATIAFGMGIDKPDVRLVVHYDLPKHLEGYYQETGRAGRDDLPSECVLFYSYGDKVKQDFFINGISDPIEKQNAELKLRKMVEYCQLQSCRRKYLLKYFGQTFHKDNCEGCDVCINPQEMFDATVISQKILSAMVRTGERFGVGYISDILRGSKNKKIRERNHDELSVFGIVDDFDDQQLKHIMSMLLSKELIQKSDGQYPTLRLTARGESFLYNRESIDLPKLVTTLASKKVKAEEILDFDQELFESLRVLRKQIADQKNVPPFVIFGDKTLQELAYYYPQTKEDFSHMFGVGDEKLKQFSEPFIAIIQSHCQIHSIEPKEVSKRSKPKTSKKKRITSTIQETKQLLLQKLSLSEMAQIREVKEGTIIGHIESIVELDSSVDIEYLKPAQPDFDAIVAAFQKHDSYMLKPAFDALKGKYSYDEIRLVRVFAQRANIIS